MTLRKKTLLTIGATLIALMVILYAGSRTILTSSFSKLEEQETYDDVQRVLDVLTDSVSQLDRVASDWAPRDDTLAFVQDGHPDYVTSNLSDSTLVSLRLNLVVFVDSHGTVVYREAFDLQNKTRTAVPPGLSRHLDSPTALLLRHPDAQSSVSGILLLDGPESPLLVASRPIVESGGQGPIRGTLIVGRYLGNAELDHLARLTRLSITLYQPNDVQVPVSDQAPVLVQPLNDQIVVGYASVKDIYGQPALVLRVDAPRDIYHQGQVSLNYLLWVLVVAGLAFVGMTLLLWDQLALSRLAHLSASVSSIGAKGDLAARVQIKGSDELSNVASAINRMLGALQQSEGALRESEVRFRQRAAELLALYETSLRLNAQLDTPQLLTAIVELAVKLLGADAGGLYVYDPQQGQLALSSGVGFFQQRMPANLRPGQGWTGRAFEEQRTVVAGDYSDWSGRSDTSGADHFAMLSVPLWGTAGALGVLDIASERDFDEHDLRLAELFAAQAGIALEKVRLHAEVQRRARGLAALNKASQAILSSLDLQAVWKLVIAEAKSLFGAEGASVLLRDPTTDGLVFAMVEGPGSEQLLGRQIPPGLGIASWVMQEKKPVLVADAYGDPRFSKQIDQATGLTTRSLVAVPLMIKGAATGVIEAINKANGAFDQDDLEMLEAMAGSVAIAMENARLFGEARKTAERLQALSRRLVEVQEAERSRIARELHDETSQALTSMMVNLRLLEREADHSEKVVARAAELKQTTDSVLENLHRLAVDLRPASLDHVGLVAALRQYIEAFSNQHNLPVQFEVVGLEGERMPMDMETALYRIVQEALTNVARHAHASRVDVILERRRDQLITIVEDNGVGFDPEASVQSDRLGLIGVRERVEMLGGTLALESDVGAGTTLLVEVPYVHSHSRS